MSVNGGSAREVERSVIIPVHNRSALTSACLDALLEHRPDATEILVVNDASSDTTPLTLSSLAGGHMRDREAYWRKTLEREFVRGYRSVAWSKNGATG